MGNTVLYRAKTRKEKRAIIERLYRAWVAYPELQLGQLIDIHMDRTIKAGKASDLFSIEDEKLIEAIEGK